MASIAQNLTSSLTGNVPKAILCVRDMEKYGSDGALYQAAYAALQTDAARQQLAAEQAAYNATQSAAVLMTNLTQSVLNNGTTGTVATYQNKTLRKTLTSAGYLALEVQYNPNTISMDTQAGVQVQYGGGNLGNASNNQLVQIDQPTATTMSFQLIFDAMNVEDAFMLQNLSLNLGNLQAGVQSITKNLNGGYSVRPQMEGLVAILTQDITRQVLFFWSEMCFQGEVVSVSSHYTMFNKNGEPIRGTVDISIRQDNEDKEREQYWDNAFTKAFGAMLSDVEVGEASDLVKYMNNNFLNLNL